MENNFQRSLDRLAILKYLYVCVSVLYFYFGIRYTTTTTQSKWANIRASTYIHIYIYNRVYTQHIQHIFYMHVVGGRSKGKNGCVR